MSFAHLDRILISKICIVFEGLLIAIWVISHYELLGLSTDF